MSEAQSILVVDDDDVFRERLARALRSRGLEASTAPDGEAALLLARKDPPELAVIDLKMPKLGGLELVTGLLAIDAHTRIVVLTGYGSIATALEAVRRGATHYLTKPADVDTILDAFTKGDGPTLETTASAAPGESKEGTPSLARVEWEHIQRVLTDCDGNISEAARRLGIHRRSLQRKLAKYPVSR